MPREGNPIAMMLYEHQITKNLTESIIKSGKSYISYGDYKELVKDIDNYVKHVSLHLSKENQTFCYGRYNTQRSRKLS